MNSRILFIARHGETGYNKNKLLQGRGINAPLNQTGEEQADLLSGYLSGYPVDYISGSSLRRSLQTAGYLAREMNLSVHSDPDLDEMDFGEFEGKHFSDVEKELKDLQKRWKNGETNLRIPGGESPEDVFKRVYGKMNTILRTNGHSCMVFVLHGRLIRILLSGWLGYGLQNMNRITHQNGSVNKLFISSDLSVKIGYLNKTNHLSKFVVS